ncbi:MAG: GNAT family N-acetyltransferase [Bryobacterales bacterium]|nr:GNAT family N-acetyltransferase [Bryobacterales bacterium]
MADSSYSPPVEIRPATMADVPAILGFIRALAEYERLSEHVVATEESLAKALFGARPAAEALLAIATPDGPGAPRAVGFALFFQNFSTFAGRPGMYLEDLFVEPEARGRGYGRALFARLAQIAVERGYCRLDWAVLDWNEPAIAFYRSLNALPMEDWTVNRLSGDALCALAAGG